MSARSSAKQALFAASILLGGCLPEASRVTVVPRPLPPLFGASQMKVVKTLQPRSQKFGLAVLSFVDQTGKAEEAEVLIGNLLAAELKETGRFELFDRQRLVDVTPPGAGPAESARRVAAHYAELAGKVDGILLGYVTSMRFDTAPPPAPISPKGAKKEPAPAPPIAALPDATPTDGELTLELRVVDTLAQNNTGVAQVKEIVVLAQGAKVRFHLDPKSRPGIVLDHDDVAKIAADIRDKIPSFGDTTLSVTDVKGDFLTLSLGEQAGVRRGMSGYVVEKNPHTQVIRYLGELVIVNTFPGASTAVLLRDQGFDPTPNVRLGATVILK
ncbi:MAG: hypothetical protein U0359_41120 [Byssovorax sp.]